MEVELNNYRVFDRARPVRWTLPSGDFVAFVGANNSGKSSLLRFFHEVRPAFAMLDLNSAGSQEAVQGRAAGMAFQSVADQTEVFSNRNEGNMTATFRLPPPDPGEEVRNEPSAVQMAWQRGGGVSVHFEYRGEAAEFESLVGGDSVTIRAGGVQTSIDLRRYRTAFHALSRSAYLGPYRNAVNVGGNSGYYDLHIGQDFISQWDQWKTGPIRGHNRAAIGIENEIRDLFAFRTLSINAAPGNETLLVNIDDEPYQLHEHGAGIAQFIVVLAFVAMTRPTYVFIDEPELHLHPTLQLSFLTTLGRYATHGVGFATHSVGLARSVGRSVYSVVRRDDGVPAVSLLEGVRDPVEFLGELSFAGYQELGFRRVVLVEGPTEVPTVQQWLRLYGIDREVVLLPLGGSSMINARSAAPLSEIRRITTRIAVLIDSERLAEGGPLAADRQGFIETCRGLDFEVHVLERRALENYLSARAIRAVKGVNYRALGPYEALRDCPIAWRKNENWRIAAEMSRDELEATDLGTFLSRLAEV